ncbi:MULTISPECIES: Rieske (2Fe-2S) protein [unclassified Arcicella]|uniref:QcrA and Rieske domain-containing protein n=1 Tax=unclassified Arcicella TaxID=2644986 RepID=UPI00285472B8|nr:MULTISPECIES: Rieske (2Fe-2S) protein [unclassified Arcicella]MDR6564000.1 cytochrome b6-f complex iron-sulfur subunit [Arcicella sp. BE51]MDR6813753.1 cytochrome b6-f complex iron-sulfur subunit [Arcicella sp. BE140]MDR6825065.1 cytochrome b6-f complex iron-sulfur subunit [Arcicella sp. BE139]
MERKEFLSLVGVSVGAIILQNCMTSCKNDSTPTPANTGGNTGGNNGGGTTTGITGNNLKANGTIDFTIDLSSASFADLKTNGKAIVSGDVIVARTKTGTYIAVAKACTHEGTTISFEPDNNRFNCPNHGSNFDLTGKVLNGPAVSPLTQFAAVFDSTKNTIKVS